MSLNTFCRFNLAYLDLWQIFNKVELDPDEDDWFAETPDPDASQYSKGDNAEEGSQKLVHLLGKYLQFNIDYFSWNIYTFDCEKNHFKQKDVKNVTNNIKSLLQILNMVRNIEIPKDMAA